MVTSTNAVCARTRCLRKDLAKPAAHRSLAKAMGLDWVPSYSALPLETGSCGPEQGSIEPGNSRKVAKSLVCLYHRGILHRMVAFRATT